MKDRVCASCGHVGKPVRQCWGSFLVDALVWGTVGSAAVITGLLTLFVIPVAWSIYHILRFNTTKCPECGDLEMVAMDSRKGKETLDRQNRITIWKPDHVEIKKAA